MDLNLKDKVALVTGGSSGIGKAICLTLAREGAKVAVNYIDLDSNAQMADEVVKEITERFSTEAMAVEANVASEEAVIRMFGEIRAKFSQIDILVNNAAVCPTCQIKDMTAKMWKQTLDVNLDGMFFCSREFIKPLVDGGLKGRVVNIASQAAFRGSTSGHAPYDASKGGMVSFTIALAREMAPLDIGVNAVAPGLVMTEMVKEVIENNREKYLNRVPLHRIAEPEDIANVVTFLASDKSGYMTGATVDVTGGILMR